MTDKSVKGEKTSWDGMKHEHLDLRDILRRRRFLRTQIWYVEQIFLLQPEKHVLVSVVIIFITLPSIW
jgi:hypothetical protein